MKLGSLGPREVTPAHYNLHLELSIPKVDPSLVDKSTVFSSCKRWRYTLWRQWGGLFGDDSRYIAFLCLNPSAAEMHRDDQTVRRCVDVANQLGFSAFCLLNIFAWRSNDPGDIARQADPVGPDNDRHILRVAAGAELVVAAWGDQGALRNRDLEVIGMLDSIRCMAFTKLGRPEHPLHIDTEHLQTELPTIPLRAGRSLQDPRAVRMANAAGHAQQRATESPTGRLSPRAVMGAGA